jgi:hypothetical protein
MCETHLSSLLALFLRGVIVTCSSTSVRHYDLLPVTLSRRPSIARLKTNLVVSRYVTKASRLQVKATTANAAMQHTRLRVGRLDLFEHAPCARRSGLIGKRGERLVQTTIREISDLPQSWRDNGCSTSYLARGRRKLIMRTLNTAWGDSSDPARPQNHKPQRH